MKVLVTGGAGFIGSFTVDKLIENGFEVRVLDNLESQVHRGKTPDYINTKTDFMKLDITKEDTWGKALNDVDALIHLAAMVGVGQSMYQPTRYLNINTIGTGKLYQYLVDNPNVRRKIQKIVVASSKSIYGEGAYHCRQHGIVYPGLRDEEQLKRREWEVKCIKCGEEVKPTGITEEKPPQNLSTYALSKYDTERIAMMFGNTFDISTIAFRYFNVFGPRQSLSNPYTGVCAIFMSRVKNNNPPVVFEDGNMIRDFIYVEDVAEANLLALKKTGKSGVFNVGTGKTTTIGDVARTIIDIYGSDVELNITNGFRFGDNRHDFADISKIQRELGFIPKWKFKEGMEKLVEWSEGQEAIDKFDNAEKERKTLLTR